MNGGGGGALKWIPQALKEVPNWIHWRIVRNSKVPFVAGSNRYASSTDPSTWTTFDEAIEGVNISSTEGVGFVIDLTNQFVGFDLDGCRDPKTGVITEWALAIIEELNSYTEYTPSGYGLRVWVKGTLPGKDRVFNLDPAAGFGDKVKIEVFDHARYFTVTGDAYFDDGGEVESRDLTEVYKLCLKFRQQYPTKAAEPKATDDTATTSAQIKHVGTVTTTKLQLLMTGKVVSDKPLVVEDGAGNSIEYPSHSEADMGLATALAMEYGNQPEIISSEFAKSPLYRDKWDRDTYRVPTINRAIATAERIKGQPLAMTQQPAAPTQQPAAPAQQPAAPAQQPAAPAPQPTEITNEMLDAAFPAYDGVDPGPTPCLIENFLPKGANFFGSLSGVGKTWMGLSVTKALTSGQPLFGVFEVKELVAVLYLVPEASNATFKRRAKRMGLTTDGTMFRYRTISQGVTLSLTDPLVVKMVQKLSNNGARQVLVIVDTAIRFLRAEDENSSTQNSLVTDSDYLRSKDIGADLLFMHHSPKASKKDAELTLENVLRGTGDFGGMADVVYGIRRDEALYSYGEGPEELEVVCVKPRDLENPPLPFRVVLKRRAKDENENEGRPVSVINETGDVGYIGPEEVKEKEGNLLDFTLRTEPYTSITNLTKTLKMRREQAKELAKAKGWKITSEQVFEDGKMVMGANGKPRTKFKWIHVGIQQQSRTTAAEEANNADNYAGFEPTSAVAPPKEKGE